MDLAQPSYRVRLRGDNQRAAPTLPDGRQYNAADNDFSSLRKSSSSPAPDSSFSDPDYVERTTSRRVNNVADGQAIAQSPGTWTAVNSLVAEYEDNISSDDGEGRPTPGLAAAESLLPSMDTSSGIIRPVAFLTAADVDLPHEEVSTENLASEDDHPNANQPHETDVPEADIVVDAIAGDAMAGEDFVPFEDPLPFADWGAEGYPYSGPLVTSSFLGVRSPAPLAPYDAAFLAGLGLNYQSVVPASATGPSSVPAAALPTEGVQPHLVTPISVTALDAMASVSQWEAQAPHPSDLTLPSQLVTPPGPMVYGPDERIPHALGAPYNQPFISFLAYDLNGQKGVVIDVMAIPQPMTVRALIALTLRHHPTIRSNALVNPAWIRVGSASQTVDPKNTRISDLRRWLGQGWLDLVPDARVPFQQSLLVDSVRNYAASLYRHPLDLSTPITVTYMFHDQPTEFPMQDILEELPISPSPFSGLSLPHDETFASHENGSLPDFMRSLQSGPHAMLAAFNDAASGPTDEVGRLFMPPFVPSPPALQLSMPATLAGTTAGHTTGLFNTAGVFPTPPTAFAAPPAALPASITAPGAAATASTHAEPTGLRGPIRLTQEQLSRVALAFVAVINKCNDVLQRRRYGFGFRTILSIAFARIELLNSGARIRSRRIWLRVPHGDNHDDLDGVDLYQVLQLFGIRGSQFSNCLGQIDAIRSEVPAIVQRRLASGESEEDLPQQLREAWYLANFMQSTRPLPLNRYEAAGPESLPRGVWEMVYTKGYGPMLHEYCHSLGLRARRTL